MADFIAKEMRRTTRDLLLVNGVLLVLLAGAALACSRYLHNFFAGPLATGIEQLDNVTKVDDLERSFIAVAGDRCFDTGWTETSYRKSKHGTVSTLHRFSVLVVGDRALVVTSTQGLVTSTNLTGELRPLPDGTRRGVEAALRRARLPEPPRLLAVELDADDYRAAGRVPLFLGGALAILAIVNLVRGVRRWRDPSRHPIVREIGRYGDFVEVATAIEVELADGVTKVGPFRLSKSWLLRSVACQLDVVKLDDILWARFRPGRHPIFELRSRIRPRLLTQISGSYGRWLLGEFAQRMPWVALGDGDGNEWKKLWKKGADVFARTIDERRKKIEAERAANPALPETVESSVPGRTTATVLKNFTITLFDR